MGPSESSYHHQVRIFLSMATSVTLIIAKYRLNAKLRDVKGYWYDRFEKSGEGSSALDQDLEQTFERIERVQRDGVS